MQITASEDFKEFLKLLIENKVEYLIIGGYAVAFHSRPKFTNDLDIWVNNTKDNFNKLVKTLHDFGFSDISDVNKDEFLQKSKVYRIGVPPRRLEVLNDIDGVKFEEAYKNKIKGKYDDLEDVYYISLNDLIKNKQSTQRTKDKLDLDFLKEFGKDS